MLLLQPEHLPPRFVHFFKTQEAFSHSSCLILICLIARPSQYPSLINISWTLVLIFAWVCCQVAMFNCAGRKENILQQTQQRNLGQPSQTQISVPLNQPAGVQPKSPASHQRFFANVYLPALKCQILYRTGSIICSKKTKPPPLLISQEQPLLLSPLITEASHPNPESCLNRNPISPCKSTSTSASLECVSQPDPCSAPLR